MYTIILAGGSGTRLFPLSRSTYPKQFLPLLKNESLFQKSIKRAMLFSKPEEIYIVTNSTHKFLAEDQLKALNTQCNILTEPCSKNTLPAITYAIKQINQTDENAAVLTLPSDQLIITDDAYKKAINEAQKLSKTHIVIFGIIPTKPHTGYGYIQKGDGIGNGYKVSSFAEKPDLPKAEKYIKEGYLWNSGMFCFSAELFIDETKKYAPEVADAFSHDDINEAYRLTPKVSVDYGLMEKTDKAAVVPLTSSWNDLGSFDALYSVKEKDVNGNAADGEYITPDGKNNLIISDKMVSTIGISDIAVIDTADVLLVCPKKESQKVGEIAEFLLNKGDLRAELHTTVHRPWGTYTIILKSDNYLIKRLLVSPKKRISLQYHNHRSEHWVIVKGTAQVTNNGKTFCLKKGESTYVPAKILHRLENPSSEPLEVIEVQHGCILTEDDIIRIDDDFKRK